MVNQYTNDRKLIIGSMDVRVALYDDTSATYASAQSIGMLDGVSFKLTGEARIEETDNAPDEDLGLSNEQAEIGATAWKNISLDVLYTLMGQTGTLNTEVGDITNVTGEVITLNGTVTTRLAHKNAGSSVTNIVIKNDVGDATYAVDTDYTVSIDEGGYTCVTRVDTGAIAAGSTVKVNYDYTALEAQTLSYKAGMIPKKLHAWLTNTNAAGEIFQIEVYMVETLKSQELSFGSDKAKALVNMPISIIGKPDPRNDFKIFTYRNEQLRS